MAGVRYVRDVRFQVLGPLRVTADGKDLPLGGPQQRLVLALLISAEGRTVSTGRLVDGVWGEDLPPTAKKALQGYVHHLRSEVGEALRTETGGYSLETGGRVDAVEFEDLQREASEILDADPGRAAELLRGGLELWKGPAYADLRDQLALASEVARLENLRLVAVGDRIDADLTLGHHESLVGELEGLTLEHPFQERFRAQHMLALYRSGRQTEALRSYERLRRFLADESGLEPSTELQQLEERILSQDESLLVAGVDPAEDPAAVRGYELREKVASDDVSETYRAYQRSIGRQVAIRVIGPRLANDPVFISNFLPDTQRIASVDHPHISYVFDTWREPGHAYQVSRWLGGGNLAEIDLTGESAMRVLSDIGNALAHCHRQGVVHGAVEASNVLFDEGGHAYLARFRVGVQSSDETGKDIADFAALVHEVIAGRPPRVVDGHRTPDLDRSHSGWKAVFETAFSTDGFGRVEDFLRAMKQASGADVVAIRDGPAPYIEARNPYKGLQAFQETDADDFFGRDELIGRLASTLESRRLVAVVGPSGSGKSSVVKAGLLSRLRSETGERVFAEMYPGAFPFEELEGALLRVGVDRTSVIKDLLSDDRGLLRILKRILPSEDTELILVIDQFEELFSTVENDGTRQLFLDSLANAVSEPHSRLRVVLTMRADFFDHPLEHPRFGEILEAGLITVTLPGDDQLAQATVMPARSEGVEFEDGLVAQIVRDVSGQPGGLPLLQYALTELFDSRDSNTITLAAYQQNGGVLGALGRRAEALYEGLTPSEQSAVREAFLRMVTVDENADDLRRRVRRSDLAGTSSQKDLDNALQSYAAARLVTFDRDPATRGPTVEVAHEALLREWPRLRHWIEAQRDDLVIRRRLDAALEEWKQSGEDAGYLPTGARLAQFEQWASETNVSLNSRERTFLQSGVEKEAERRARIGRRRRLLVAGLTSFSIILAVLLVVAIMQQRRADRAAAEAETQTELATASATEADRQRELAESNQARAEASAAAAETGRLAADAVLLAGSDRRLALLLAAEAYQRDPGPNNLGALQRVMIRNPGFLGYAAYGQPYSDIRWIEGGHIIALGSSRLDVYDSTTKALSLSVDVSLPVIETTFERLSPRPPFDVSDETVVLGTSDFEILVVDLASGTTRFIPPIGTTIISSLALSSDASLLAVGDTSGTLRLLELDTGREMWSVEAHPERVYADIAELRQAGFVNPFQSPEGSIECLLASRNSPGSQICLGEGQAFGAISAISFSLDDEVIATSHGVFVRRWQTETGDQIGGDLKLFHPDPDPDLLGTNAGPNGFPFLVSRELIFADDALIASGNLDTAFFQPDESPWPRTVRVPTGTTAGGLTYGAGLEVLPNSDLLYALSDGRIVRRDPDSGAVLAELDTQLAEPRSLALDPTGSKVAVAAEDGIMIAATNGAQLLASALPRDPRHDVVTINSDGSVVTSGAVFATDTESAIWHLSAEGGPIRLPAPEENPHLLVRADPPAQLNQLVQWDWTEPDNFKAIFYELPGMEPTGVSVPDAILWTISRDGRYMANLNSERGGFDVYDPQTGRVLIEGLLPTATVDRMDRVGSFGFSADGSRLMIVLGNRARVFDTESWAEQRDLRIDGVVGAAYGPDGRFLTTVSSEGRLTLLEAETHEPVDVIVTDQTLIGSWGASFSPDGSLVLTESNLTLYDIATGTPIGEPFLHDAGTTAGITDSESLKLVTAVDDDILIWNLDTSTWFDIACEAAGRNMTRDEWEQFGPNDTQYRATCPQYGLVGDAG